MSLATVRSTFFASNNERLLEFVAKRVIRDILLALDYCHNLCNTIHTGTPGFKLIEIQSFQAMIDIKPHNILTKLKGGLELTVPDVVVESIFDHEE
jgi:serine/threonine protein kinase